MGSEYVHNVHIDLHKINNTQSCVFDYFLSGFFNFNADIFCYHNLRRSDIITKL